jgi:hypothetical protein
MWGAISDERTGLSFTVAAGPHQRNHSRVRVPWVSRPHFTVPDSSGSGVDCHSTVKVKVILRLMVTQSVSSGVEPNLGLMAIYLSHLYSYGLVFVGRPLWREDGSVFCICCWLCQHSLSRVLVPWDPRPYFTVSVLRLLPFSSPPTTRRVTVEISSPASTRVPLYSWALNLLYISVRTGERWLPLTVHSLFRVFCCHGYVLLESPCIAIHYSASIRIRGNVFTELLRSKEHIHHSILDQLSIDPLPRTPKYV